MPVNRSSDRSAKAEYELTTDHRDLQRYAQAEKAILICDQLNTHTINTVSAQVCRQPGPIRHRFRGAFAAYAAGPWGFLSKHGDTNAAAGQKIATGEKYLSL